MSGYMVGVEYIDDGRAVGACCECEVSERSQGWLCSLCIWGLGIGVCVCTEGDMSVYMGGVEYIDEGLAVGACCECEVSEGSQGWLCSTCIWGLWVVYVRRFV